MNIHSQSLLDNISYMHSMLTEEQPLCSLLWLLWKPFSLNKELPVQDLDGLEQWQSLVVVVNWLSLPQCLHPIKINFGCVVVSWWFLPHWATRWTLLYGFMFNHFIIIILSVNFIIRINAWLFLVVFATLSHQIRVPHVWITSVRG